MTHRRLGPISDSSWVARHAVDHVFRVAEFARIRPTIRLRSRSRALTAWGEFLVGGTAFMLRFAGLASQRTIEV